MNLDKYDSEGSLEGSHHWLGHECDLSARQAERTAEVRRVEDKAPSWRSKVRAEQKEGGRGLRKRISFGCCRVSIFKKEYFIFRL